jgi:hypothetical protein
MSHFLFLQEVAYDVEEREILEEDRKAKAILKEFAKGTCVDRADPAEYVFAIHKVMLTVRRLPRASVSKMAKNWWRYHRRRKS